MSAGVKGPVLPWMRVPITIKSETGVPLSSVLGLDPRLVSELEQGFHFQELFPVQAAVWRHCGGGASTAHDLCVAAPTGSGKTLAYALPVVNALAGYQRGSLGSKSGRGAGDAGGGGGRLRALVVLPTRDLAAQVYGVLKPLCAAVGLRVALAAARSSEAAEAAQLVGAAAGSSPGSTVWRATALGANEGAGAAGGGGADVVIATPGRLMAHLTGTPGFTLRHLRFLVMDEIDRLLRQSYQEWLPRVLAALEPPSTTPTTRQHQQHVRGSLGRGETEADLPRTEHFACCWPAASLGAALPFAKHRVVKIAVSATLTRDPAKLQRLQLYQPRYVATTAVQPQTNPLTTTTAVTTAANTTPDAALTADQQPEGSHAPAAPAPVGCAGALGACRYSLPRTLSEYRVMCSGARKPLVLLALLAAGGGQQSTIVFTSSLDMTHKLYLMLRAVPDLPYKVVEYSSMVPQRERAAALERFKSGEARVLVASDAMTRGMDMQAVQRVINYDAPVYTKTYVHRAGRTARAGKTGCVMTLLRDEDMRHFKAMLRKADNNYVREMKVAAEEVEGWRPALAGALVQVEALLAAERSTDEAAMRAAAGRGGPGGGGARGGKGGAGDGGGKVQVAAGQGGGKRGAGGDMGGPQGKGPHGEGQGKGGEEETTRSEGVRDGEGGPRRRKRGKEVEEGKDAEGGSERCRDGGRGSGPGDTGGEEASGRGQGQVGGAAAGHDAASGARQGSGKRRRKDTGTGEGV